MKQEINYRAVAFDIIIRVQIDVAAKFMFFVWTNKLYPTTYMNTVNKHKQH